MLKTPVSDIRKRYILRPIGRCVILLLAVFLYATDFPRHDILQGFFFFHKLSWLHALWEKIIITPSPSGLGDFFWAVTPFPLF